jgi:formylglycine-generating enzyme required for sulfatase activity
MKFGELSKWLAVVGLAWFSVQAGAQQAPPCPTSPTAGVICTVGGVDFVAIPGGRFAMGDSSALASPIEQPVHDVVLDPSGSPGPS